MDATEIQRKAAETIIERGVRVKLPAPRFLRLLGKKTISVTIHRPTLRTMFTALSFALKEGFSIDGLAEGKTDAALKLIVNHSQTVCQIVAVHLLNDKWLIRLFSRPLSRWLFSKLNNGLLLDISVTIVLLSRYQDFTTTIRLFKGLTMNLTTPKNLSPEGEGSQEATQ